LAKRSRRRGGRLRRQQLLARRAVTAEHLLQVLDVDVEVVQRRLEVVPLRVQGAAERRPVAVGDQRLVLHVHLAVEVHIALQSRAQGQRQRPEDSLRFYEPTRGTCGQFSETQTSASSSLMPGDIVIVVANPTSSEYKF